jgi:hypothetical protein
MFPVCEPDEEDIAAPDTMFGACDCEHPSDCRAWFQPAAYNEDGRCIWEDPRPLIDEYDAEDMAGLDDPRSLASLETAA